MPLKLDIKRKFSQRSERVKGVDLHPTESWLLANLYNGHVCIYNHAEGSLVKSFEAADLPARCAKFVARKQWVAIGSDDMFIRVFNYNTMDRVKAFEAHADYIRSIAVHPTLPYLLSCSDDMLIKLWDWDKGFACAMTFEGHVHYVMQVVFNPKDTSTFASASLDRTVKVWNIGQPTPNFTLEGHEKGVNCVDYFGGGDRPYLVSGADDKTAKVWDYQTKACVQTLEGHSNNVSAVAFHPELPVILTGSEDGSVRIWHNTTYRLEGTLSYGMERVWALGVVRGANAVAVGYDDGLVMIRMGSEEPVASMDAGGKIVWARHNDVQAAAVKALGEDYELVDGERLPLPVKDLGSSEIFPAALRHNSNGRFVAICGDGEYVIYTALAWRNKAFGSAAEFVWSAESNDFATRETRPDLIRVHRNFKEAGTIPLRVTPESIHGGALLGVRASDHIAFYDWTTLRCVRRIDVAAESALWNPGGDMLALTTATSFFVLKYERDVVTATLASGAELDEDGIEDAFEVVTEIDDRVRTGLWVGDCFIFSNASWRLNYCVGGEVTTLFHLDRPLHLLGYLMAQQRVYLVDREYSVVTYTLLLSMVEFKTLVMRDELDKALAMLDQIPEDQLDGVAKFLEGRGHVAKALEIAKDKDYKFELALQLNDIDAAVLIAEELQSEARWKQLGELALADGRLALAERCLRNAGDLSGMMLMHSATGNRKGMQEVADAATEAGKQNVAFLARFLLQDVSACIELLTAAGRLPEATLFARTYAPSRVPDLVAAWQKDFGAVNAKAAEALASPAEYGNLFDGWESALRLEGARAGRLRGDEPATDYSDHEMDLARDLLAAVVAGSPAADGNSVAAEEEAAAEVAPDVNGQADEEEEEVEEVEVEEFVEEESEGEEADDDVEDVDDVDLDDLDAADEDLV